MERLQLRLIWWWARVDWRGGRLPTPPTQPHPPDPTPENLPKPLARWATISLLLLRPHVFQNMQRKKDIWKCVGGEGLIPN